MKRCIAAMLLVLSVAGQLSAAVADDNMDAIIRLPTHDVADDLVTAGSEKGAEAKRPWKCCDSTWCSRSIPPACRCMDAVEQCDEACKDCAASQSDPSKHICTDRYRGWSGPRCAKPDDDIALVSNGVAGHHVAAAVHDEKARSWKYATPPPRSSGYTKSTMPPPRSSGYTRSAMPPPSRSNRYIRSTPQPPRSSGYTRSTPPPPRSSGYTRSTTPPPRSSGYTRSTPPPARSSGYTRLTTSPPRSSGYSRSTPPSPRSSGCTRSAMPPPRSRSD